MGERFHGIDRHRRASTVPVLNREGVEEKFVSQIYDFNGYVERLGPKDVVVMETGTGAFYWADKIEARGAQCFIIDPYRFRIIKDSWNNTDKRDSRNMSKAISPHRVASGTAISNAQKRSNKDVGAFLRSWRRDSCGDSIALKQGQAFLNDR